MEDDKNGKFLDAVGRNVGVIADFGNIYESRDDLLDFIKAYGDKIVHVHIKDAPTMVEIIKMISNKF